MEQPWSLSFALKHPIVLQPGDTIWLREGVYRGEFTSRLVGELGKPLVVRQFPNERAIIDGSLIIDGSSATYWGFEIRNSDPTRVEAQWTRPTGVKVNGPRTKLINLVVHDAGQGIAWWMSAVDSEIHGCLIYNNGNSHFDHGIYAQNREGTKHITDNIVFNNFGYGLHLYGSEGASLKDFSIRGNTIFNNGVLGGNGSIQNIIVSGGAPVEQIALYSNFSYSSTKHGSIQLGSPESGNKGLEMYQNYFVDFVSFRYWDSASVVGNTIIAPTTLLILQLKGGPTTASYLWDRNTYYSEELRWQPFNLGDNLETDGLSFRTWTATTGFDAQTTYVKGRPAGTQVFLRHNRYEPGRINVTVYNWSGQRTVPVDMKPWLSIGAAYEIRNAQDFFSPAIAQGVFDGNLIELPTSGLTVAQPVGLPVPAPSGPEFNVFVVLPVNRPIAQNQTAGLTTR